MKNNYKHLLKNTIWISLGTFGSKTISFFLLPIFTRVLSTNDYGKIDFFATTISLSIVLLSLEIGAAVFRFSLENERSENNEILSSSFLILAPSTLLILTFLSILSMFIPFFSEIKYYLLFSIILGITTGIYKNYLRAKEKMLVFATSDIINTFTFANFGIILVAIFKKGVIGYLQAYLIAQLITNIYLFTAGKLYKEISFKKISFKYLKEMIKYSAPFVPNDLSWWIMNASDRYLLIYFLGFKASGIYSVSYKFMALITVLIGIFYKSWQISAIKQYNKKNRVLFYSNIFYFLYTSLMLIIILYSLIMKPLIKIMVGIEFESAWKYLPFLILGTSFLAFSGFYGSGYIVSKESKGAFTTSIYGAITNLVINAIFIPIIGTYAAAISTMVAFLVMWLLRLKQTKKYFTINVNWMMFMVNIFLVIISLFANYFESLSIRILIQIICLILFIGINLKFIKKVFWLLNDFIKNWK